jgi:GT2 family glycosyltransferase
MVTKPQPRLGVVIVTYDSEAVIRQCLNSLVNSENCSLNIVVVDNASTDNTRTVLKQWAREVGDCCEPIDGLKSSSVTKGAHTVSTIDMYTNLGFAGGVNVGLRRLLKSLDLDLFWILNPDCVARPETASVFAETAASRGRFGLMGGRIVYIEPADTIQSDGGRFNRWTGMCKSINLSKNIHETPFPDEDKLDYISGASIIVSREYIEEVGLMDEYYFLYYEEVDWALRRRDFPLLYAPGAIVLHHGGTSIGSPLIGRKQGSSFSNYFNYRNRMRIIEKFHNNNKVISYVYSALKVIRLLVQGYFPEAGGAFRGLHDLAPPASVQTRLSSEARHLACRK